MGKSKKHQNEKLRVAVIGCGAIGSLHARAVTQSRHAQMMAACDVEPKRAEAVAESTGANVYGNFEDLLLAERLDVVTVATPEHLHLAPVVKSMEAGCHVFCEKPMASTLKDAKRMADVAAQLGRHLAIDYNRRFGFGYLKAKDLCTSGAVGEIRYVMIRVTEPLTGSKDNLKEYSIIKNVLVHHIDLMRFFCGEICSIHASFRPRTCSNLGHDVAISLQFEGDALGTLIGGWQNVPRWTRTSEWTEIGGTNGTVVIEDVMQTVKYWSVDPDQVECFRPNYFRGQSAFYDSLTDHIHCFLSRLANGKSPAVTGQDGLRGLEIVDAAVQSNRTGQVVHV
ncbi:MAG: Gfo/Idh/MocA family oxidoreductase [Candidatus Poribacteria bacterium]|nr:Gfo/Idh/MocA family oxidoreductase [Candidatus Poribacteria bacterium]MDE0505745.1 Gfo/Idh/MocA family oxidoreductase [Candidatus Poribacteria bacterium]